MTDTSELLELMGEQTARVLEERADEYESPPLVHVHLGEDFAPESDREAILWVGLRVAQVPHFGNGTYRERLDALVDSGDHLSVQTTYEEAYDVRVDEASVSPACIEAVTGSVCTEVYGSTLEAVVGVEWEDIGHGVRLDGAAFVESYPLDG